MDGHFDGPLLGRKHVHGLTEAADACRLWRPGCQPRYARHPRHLQRISVVVCTSATLYLPTQASSDLVEDKSEVVMV